MYGVNHGFIQALLDLAVRFDFEFKLLALLQKKLILTSKVVKSDPKIINYLLLG